MKNSIRKKLVDLFHIISARKNRTSEEEKRIIDSFCEPQDDYDRAYYNHCCFEVNKFGMAILNAVGCVAIVPFAIIYVANNLLFTNREKADAVIIFDSNRAGANYSLQDRIPTLFYNEYDNVKEAYFNNTKFPPLLYGQLSREAFATWCLFAARHPLSGFENFRALLVLSGYARLIKQYKPEIILTSRTELTNMSSLVTALCKKYGVEYACFMHGEMLASAKYAFVHFSRFYMWDAYYSEILDWARAKIDRTIVYTPRIHEGEKKSTTIFDYLFCLSGSNDDITIDTITNFYSSLIQKGYKCKIRPHPRWSKIEELKLLFGKSGVTIEDPKKISSKESIRETKTVVGSYSSMLMEAYYMGKRVIIDDCSDPNMIADLRERKYILLSKEHTVLSEEIEKLKKKSTEKKDEK